MTDVAVIGLGTMGSRIARRLLDAGHDVVVGNRDPAKAAGFPRSAGSAPEAALAAVTQFPPDAEFTLVQMSTVGPSATERLAARLPAGVELLDAPVLGSTAEAEAGTLRIFAGGSEELVARLTPLLSTLGAVTPVGGVGAGSAAKLVANFALLSTIAALGESLALGEQLGLVDDAVFDVLATTPLAA